VEVGVARRQVVPAESRRGVSEPGLAPPVWRPHAQRERGSRSRWDARASCRTPQLHQAGTPSRLSRAQGLCARRPTFGFPASSSPDRSRSGLSPERGLVHIAIPACRRARGPRTTSAQL